MVSKRASGWKWYDWLVFLVVVIIICAAIQIIAPSSGLAHALHQGFHFLSLLVGWIAGGLTALAQLLNQL